MSYKSETFKEEIEFIQDERVKKFVNVALEILPDYFFKIPSSSSGKYHPAYALGEGGLVRHTKACIRIAMELYRLEMFNHFSQLDRDYILASLILHDGFKNGRDITNKFSVTDHPLVMAEEIKISPYLANILQPSEVNVIADNVVHHMGAFTKDYKTGVEVLEKPKNKMQNFVHLCDYLASRKCLEMNFNVKFSPL